MINDSEYWNHYYAKHFIDEPSPFAEFCQTGYYARPQTILEFGCGSGRDSIYFSRMGHRVIGIDLCPTAIGRLQAMDVLRCEFAQGDFTTLPERDGFDSVYSRWSIHSVERERADHALEWVSRNLEVGGLFCVEVRSINDRLCGIGEARGDDAFFTDHYRRFIRKEEFLDQLRSLSFSIEFETESGGLSVYKDDDPVLIRVVARKSV